MKDASIVARILAGSSERGLSLVITEKSALSAATRPSWDGKQFVPRLILPLSLSWDHRVVDGAGAARFNTYLAQLLADFRRVLV